jgi:3-oxoacyl-[acyl-carrier protein] reductase
LTPICERNTVSDNALFPGGAALVVGASGGIGGKIADVLAGDGCTLALAYNRNADRAQAVADRIGGGTTIHRCDVTAEQDVAALVEAAIAAHGRIHTLVWAAGPLVDQLYLGETPVEKWRSAFEIEVHGFFRLATALLPHMREQGGGSIALAGQGRAVRRAQGGE